MIDACIPIVILSNKSKSSLVDNPVIESKTMPEDPDQVDEWDDDELEEDHRLWLPSWIPTLVCGLLGAVWLVLFRIQRVDDNFAFLLVTLQVIAWVYIATIPHEIAHALMAKVLGAGVKEIRFGSGPRLASIRLLGISWHWHLNITGVNYVKDEFHSDRWFRLRCWLIVAAGPAMNLLLALGGILIVGLSSYDEFIPQEGYAIVQTFVIGNMVAAAAALWPWTYYEEDEDYPTDGLQLLTIPWMTDEEVKEAVEYDIKNSANDSNIR